MSETELPWVSVILPVRNGARFLAQALESVRAQNYPTLEVIIVDGHSTDHSARIAREFAEARWVTQPGRGVSDAYNFGVAQARADWIAFLEHDDLWTPEKLRRQIGRMRQAPDLEFTLTRAELFLEPGCPLPPGYNPRWLEGSHTGALLSSFVARKSVFARVGGFDPTLACAGDVDWFARAKDLRVPMAILDACLLRKRIHDANLTRHAAVNNTELLRVLRRSLQRQRTAAPSTPPHA